MTFYVYQYTDPSNMEKIYIGKGRGDRDTLHWRKSVLDSSNNYPFICRLCKIKDQNKEPIIERIWEQDDSFESNELAEEFAFLVEEEAIEKYGRRIDNTGTLWNLTKGGEGCTGYIHTEEHKRYIGKLTGDRLRGTVLSEDHKQKIRDKLKGNQHLRCHKHSKETKEKMAMSTKKQWTDDLREQQSERMRGNTHLSGYAHSEETKEKIRQANYNRQYIFSEEALQRLSQSKPKVECPVCGRIGGKPVMVRYHFDKCRWGDK